MTEIIDSIAIESSIKRIPKSRQGKVLVVMRDQIINDLKDEVKHQKFHVPTDKVNRVSQLNKEIKKRLIREDRKHRKQTQLLIGIDIDQVKTYEVRYIRPGQKRVRIEKVGATSESKAKSIIKKANGHKTKIKSVKTF